MTKLASVFAVLLLIFAGNVRNINAADTGNRNPDATDINIVLDGQDFNRKNDGVFFTLDNPDLNFDADGFLNVDSNRGLDLIDDATDNDDTNVEDRYLDNDGFDNDGGNLFDGNDLSSDIRE